MIPLGRIPRPLRDWLVAPTLRRMVERGEAVRIEDPEGGPPRYVRGPVAPGGDR